MAEFGVLSQYNDEGDSSIDYSEAHLAYFCNHVVDDQNNWISNDMEHYSGYDNVNGGGNAQYAILRMMAGVGPASEADYPYSEFVSNGNNVNYAAGSGMTSEAWIKSSFIIEHPEGYIDKSSATDIKNAILSDRFVSLSYYHSAGGNYYNAGTAAYNYPFISKTNHEVGIVGWDDSYPKENFSSSARPSTDGAWLVRNNWDSSWGSSGYFWMSYECKSIGTLVSSKALLNKDAPKTSYQYDGGGAIGNLPSSVQYGAAIFKAVDDEQLTGAAVYLTDNASGTLTIYELREGYTNPVDGTKLSEISINTVSHAGYYYIPFTELTSPCSVNKNQIFSAVLSGTAPTFEYDYVGGSYAIRAATAEGRSYYSTNGTAWTDTANDIYSNICDLRIKVYGDVVCNTPATALSIQEAAIEVNKDDSEEITVSVQPETTDDIIKYTSSDTSIAKVVANGSGGKAGATVTGVRPGTATITAAARTGLVKDTCEVTVVPNTPATSISVSPQNAKAPARSVYTFNVTLNPSGSDDIPTWTSSDASIATIAESTQTSLKVNCLNQGNVTFTGKTYSGGSIESKTCTVSLEIGAAKNEAYTLSTLPRKLYKGTEYTLTVRNDAKISKYQPTSIEYEISSSNVKLTSNGSNGTDGCTLNVTGAASSGSKGEKCTLIAIVKYLQKGKEKEKRIKKNCTLNILVNEVSLAANSISSLSKDRFTLEPVLNGGRADDVPTNQKLKYLITDENGVISKNGKKVISVSSKGVVKFKGPGSTYITVAAMDSYDRNTKKYGTTIIVPVTCPEAEYVKFSSDSLTVAPKSSIGIRSMLSFASGKVFNEDAMKLKYTVSNKRLASINSKGLLKTKKLTGTFTVTVEAVGGVMKGKTAPKGSLSVTIANTL